VEVALKKEIGETPEKPLVLPVRDMPPVDKPTP
jgi:hypothetical protein